jgi:hypothetical protein
VRVSCSACTARHVTAGTSRPARRPGGGDPFRAGLADGAAGRHLPVSPRARPRDRRETDHDGRVRFGYWVYGIAVSLWELRHRGDYGQFRAALIEGYARHRPPPYGDLAHLDDFIAARDVAFGLWFAGNAQVSPVFRAGLDEVLASVGRSLDVLLGD